MKHLFIGLRGLFLFVALVTPSFAQPTPASPGTCFATSGGSAGILYTVDLGTGAATEVDSTGLIGLPGLAINSAGDIYATTRSNPFQTARLYRLDAQTADTTFVGNLGMYFVDGIAFDSLDVLYGFGLDSFFAPSLFTIDTADASTATVASTLTNEYAGLAFDPTDGTLFGSMPGSFSYKDSIATIDPVAGTDAFIGSTGLGGATPDIAFEPSGNLYGLKGGGRTVNNLISINKQTGQGAVIGPLGFSPISGLACNNSDEGGPSPAIDIFVDIKPQACPNTLNTKAKSVINVAVLGSAEFDVTTIDPSTVSLAGLTPSRVDTVDVSRPPAGGDECACTEEEGDGYHDLVLQFKNQDILAFLGDVADGDIFMIALTGNLVNGTPMEGDDCVEIKAPGRSVAKRPASDEPAGFALEANYPNPFNPSTTVTFILAEDSFTDLAVYDVTGRRLRSLVSHFLTAGRHTFVWDGTNDDGRTVASGLYIYKLSAGDFVRSRKMLLLE